MGKKKDSNKKETVTRLPGWVLKWKGGRDSRKGKSVCDEYIRCLCSRLVSLESDAAAEMTARTAEERKKVAAILKDIPKQARDLDMVPGTKKEDCVEAIRENSKNMEKRSVMENGLAETVKQLTIINEVFRDADTDLDEYINCLRNDAAERIHRYVLGVRCGKLREYEWSGAFEDDTAREIYRARRRELDEKIRSVIGDDTEEKGEEEACLAG